MLLKSLRKAEYSPSETLHYALGIEHYAHFTSPIRRYPDLIVHRLLDLFLSGKLKTNKAKVQWNERVAAWAKHCSTTERRSEEAEREITKLKLLRYLQDHADKLMNGTITGIQEYGLFVQIDEYLLDGLVHIRTLTDDFYKVDKKKDFPDRHKDRQDIRLWRRGQSQDHKNRPVKKRSRLCDSINVF